MVPITRSMGLQEAEPMTQLIDAAQRLRSVRAAYRRFLFLWVFENDRRSSAGNRPQLRRTKASITDLRQLRLFDDL